VEFNNPRDRDSNLDNDIKISFRVDSVYGIDKTELEIDGTKIRSFTGLPYEHEIHLDDGVHQIRAIAYDRQGNQSDRRITVVV
jgi:hypothetical protein